MDSIAVLNKLRNKHASNEEDAKFYGVDIKGATGICNTYQEFVWEPILVRNNALQSATEAACMILGIDETVKNPKSDQDAKMK